MPPLNPRKKTVTPTKDPNSDPVGCYCKTKASFGAGAAPNEALL